MKLAMVNLCSILGCHIGQLLIFATKKVLVKFLPSSNAVDKVFWKGKSHTIDIIRKERRQITLTKFCLDFL